MEEIIKNARTLEKEMNWLAVVLETRIGLYFNNECSYKSISEIEVPVTDPEESDYAKLLHQLKLSDEERIALILALTPYLKPHILDLFFTRNAMYDRFYTEFGGVETVSQKGFLPTGQTLLFTIAGNDLEKRMQVEYDLLQNSQLFKRNILSIEPPQKGNPPMSGLLQVGLEYPFTFRI